MDGKYLLDTNIMIAALSSDTNVLGRLDDADHAFDPATRHSRAPRHANPRTVAAGDKRVRTVVEIEQ